MNSKLTLARNPIQMPTASVGGYWPSLFVQLTEKTQQHNSNPANNSATQVAEDRICGKFYGSEDGTEVVGDRCR